MLSVWLPFGNGFFLALLELLLATNRLTCEEGEESIADALLRVIQKSKKLVMEKAGLMHCTVKLLFYLVVVVVITVWTGHKPWLFLITTVHKIEQDKIT